MSNLEERFKDLVRFLDGKVKRRIFRRYADVITKNPTGASYVEVSWRGPGRKWTKLTGQDIGDLTDSDDNTVRFNGKSKYTYEVRFFLREGSDLAGGNGWGDVSGDIGKVWKDLSVEEFFGVSQLSGPKNIKGKWTELSENPEFPTPKKATRKVLSAIPWTFGDVGSIIKALLLLALGAVLLAGAARLGVELPFLSERDTGTRPAAVEHQEPIVDREREEALERDLAAAEERNEALEDLVAIKDAKIEAQKRELERLNAKQDKETDTRSSGGLPLSLQPCWVNPEGTHAEYIYDVHLSDAGIKVSKTWKAYRAADYEALPVAGVSLDQVVDRYTFAAQFVPLYDRSVEQNCRHFVRVYEGDHEGVDLYKAQRDAVESFFYIYRPHRTRY